MLCNRCGKELPEDSSFCPYCGAELGEENKPGVPKEKKKGHGAVYAAVAVFIIGAGVLIGFAAGQGSIGNHSDSLKTEVSTKSAAEGEQQTLEATKSAVVPVAEAAEEDVESAVVEASNMTQEKIQQAASDMLNDLLEYSVSDTDKFRDLCIGFSEEDLQGFLDYCAEVYREHYAKQIVKIVLSQDPYYQIDTCCYTVAGTHPNTSMSNHTLNFLMCLTDEGWKVNNSEEALNAVDTPENYALLYPEDFLNAYYEGRNAANFGYALLLDDTTVFEGDYDASLAYLYQNEDGSAEALFWLANGTSGALSVNEISITVTDDTLGVVLDQSVSCNEMVNAGYAKMVQLHFEPEQVLTGTQTWTTMSSNCQTKY